MATGRRWPLSRSRSSSAFNARAIHGITPFRHGVRSTFTATNRFFIVSPTKAASRTPLEWHDGRTNTDRGLVQVTTRETNQASCATRLVRRVAVVTSIALSLAMATGAALAMPPPIPPPHPLLGLLVDDAGTLLVARGGDALYRRAAADAAWQRVLPLRAPMAEASPLLFDGGRAGWFLTWERRDAESSRLGISPWTGPASRSTDHGSTWHAVPAHHWLAVDGRGQLLGTDDGIRLVTSVDGGKSILRRPLFTCPGKEACIAHLSMLGETWVIANGFGDSVQRSDDGGKTWAASTVGGPVPQVRLGTSWLATRYWTIYRRDDRSPDWQPFQQPADDRMDTLLAATRPDGVLVMRQWRGEDMHMDFPPPILRKEACVTDLRRPCRWTPIELGDRLLNLGAATGGPPPLAWRGNALYGYDWYTVRRAVVIGDSVQPSRPVDDRGFLP